MLTNEPGGGNSKPAKPSLKKWDKPAEPAPKKPASRIEQLTSYTREFEVPAPANPTPTSNSFSTPEPEHDYSTGLPLQRYQDRQLTREQEELKTVIGQGGVKDAPATLKRSETTNARVKQLTWEEYNALSDDQRAAVDFNTMLVQAREKDLNTDYDSIAGSTSARKDYFDEVRRMFGESGGSDTYAPETLAVLRSIDYKPTAGQSLDDFLSMDGGISAKELKNFEIEKSDKPILFADNTVKAGGALVGEEQAAQRTSRLQQAMAKSGQLLHNWRASAAAQRSSLAVRYGGTANEVKTKLGFGMDEDSVFFRKALSALSMDLAPEQLDGVWAELNQKLVGEKKDAFLKYADDLTRDALTLQPPEWALAEGVSFEPTLIRDRLGFNRGGRDAGS